MLFKIKLLIVFFSLLQLDAEFMTFQLSVVTIFLCRNGSSSERQFSSSNPANLFYHNSRKVRNRCINPSYLARTDYHIKPFKNK